MPFSILEQAKEGKEEVTLKCALCGKESRQDEGEMPESNEVIIKCKADDRLECRKCHELEQGQFNKDALKLKRGDLIRYRQGVDERWWYAIVTKPLYEKYEYPPSECGFDETMNPKLKTLEVYEANRLLHERQEHEIEVTHAFAFEKVTPEQFQKELDQALKVTLKELANKRKALSARSKTCLGDWKKWDGMTKKSIKEILAALLETKKK